MILHDAVAEQPFEAAFDARFPYRDAEAASALIAQGWSISLNAAFCVLHEICRPPQGVRVSEKRLRELLAEWRAGPEHALKLPLVECAEALIGGTHIPWQDGVRLMDEIAKFDAQRAALSIAYFSSDCSRKEGDDALTETVGRVRRIWEAKGI